MLKKTILDDEKGARYDTDEVVKHSKNIIDLIEVEDFVNGEKVLCFRNNNCDYDVGTEYREDFDTYYGYDKEDIETILTKEQYMQNCYKIEKGK